MTARQAGAPEWCARKVEASAQTVGITTGLVVKAVDFNIQNVGISESRRRWGI